MLRTFNDLTYAEYWTLFRSEKFQPEHDANLLYFRERTLQPGPPCIHVILRSESRRHLARLHSARPSDGERFYLRRLLQVRSAYSYDDLKTVDGVLHPTFQEAAKAFGLFNDEAEAEYAMHEAVSQLSTPRQLRFLFADLLLNDVASTPLALWQRFADSISLDFTICLHSPVLGQNAALREMASFMREHGKTLEQFGLPAVEQFGREVEHEHATWDPHTDHLLHRATDAFHTFNAEQRSIFLDVADAFQSSRPLLIFIDGKAGRGKTFLVNAICDYIRSQRRIVLPTATSAFAALLYPGGRTTHSAFKVSFQPTEE
jgi:hypothetical protein